MSDLLSKDWQIVPLPRQDFGDSPDPVLLIVTLGGSKAAIIARLDEGTEEEKKAHARLIAKAPKMYELLREVIDQWPEFEDDDVPVDGGDMVEWFAEFYVKAKKLTEE